MTKATNRVTGATVSGDEATLRRLGHLWEVEAEKPKAAPRKAPAKKSTEK